MRKRSALLALAVIGGATVLAVTLLNRDGAQAQTPPAAPADRVLDSLRGGAIPSVVSNAGPLDLRKSDKLSSELDQLQRVDAASRLAGHAVTRAGVQALPDFLRSSIDAGQLSIDDAGTVQVFVETAGDPVASVALLRALGLSVERTDGGLRLVQGRIPIPALRQAADLDGVISVRAPERAVLQAGSVTSQGDAILGGPALRSTYGADGSNVRVGVISDGMEGMAASQGSGDLPLTVNITTCNKAPSGKPTDSGAGAEGTAMSEIVHDLAPGAEIWFGYFNFALGTVLDFQAAVNCLAQNTDVVLDDIGWFGVGPYDGSSSVSMNAMNALNNASNRIRGYYTAVGNDAQNHYEESYTNSGFVWHIGPDSWVFHQYQATSNTTDAGFAVHCQVSPTVDVTCGDQVQLVAGGSMTVILEWNDPWASSANDYDLLLFDETTSAVSLASADRQNGAGHHPVEGFSITNPHATQSAFDIIIGNYKGLAAPRTFNMFVLCSGCATYSTGAKHNFDTIAGSVANNSDAGGGVMASGAINQADASHTNIESFSSHGPTVDNRVKPDITAIDGVSVTGDGGFPSTFFGTSATSPHVGAIAALVLTCKPSLKRGEIGDNPAADRTALHNALTSSAVDLGPPGADNTFGAGRISAPAAAAAAGCLPDGDGDGCPNANELGPNHQLGGDRDPNNPWDFFDVPTPVLTATNTFGSRNRSVTLGDVIAILFYIGTSAAHPNTPNLNGVTYGSDLNENGVPDGQEYDRTATVDPLKPWRSGPPDGAVTISDAIVALAQVGDTCAT